MRMKKALILSVSILLLAGIFAVTQIPAQQVTADGELVSKDSDFQLNGTTLVKYTGTAKTVSVPASVTEIGEEAFAGNTFMENLTFKGDLVETIGYHAFAGCSGLESVELPDSVTTLGNGAFSNATHLEQVTFGSGMHYLGIGAFSGCSDLEQLTISEDNTYFAVEDDCLYDDEKTILYMVLPGRDKESYNMPNTVTDIAEYAFWGCDDIKSITISSNLNEIPDYAFANAKGLTGITIPYSVRSIGARAFADCVNLETVTIPVSVTSIHDTAFDGCSKLKISALEGSVADQFYDRWQELNQAEYEDTGNDGADEDTVSEGDGTQPDDGTLLGSSYVVGNRAMVFIDNSKTNVYGSDWAGGVVVSPLENEELSSASELPKFTVAFDTVIADQAFYRGRGTTDYAIPDGITEIGEFSFARSDMTSVVIPSGVTEIGYGAFYHCDYLREVSIPNSVTYIAPKAFEKSRWLENWLAGNGEDFLIVGNGILLAYRGESADVVLPDTVKRIAPEVFAGNASIASVTLPDSVIDVGEDAFASCSNLKTVNGGANVRVIRDRAFQNCPLESAHVWENVEYIGLAAFDFAQTAFGLSEKVIVFDGEQIPGASYELTAQRLSNSQARRASLGDASFAIVDRSVQPAELAGTVLDPQQNSFEGIIAYISSRDRGIVTCIATTYTQEEYENMYIPAYITIDGKSYEVTETENVTVFGSEYTPSEGVVDVRNHSELLSGRITAELEGNTGDFYLRIEDSEDAYEQIADGYEAVYGQELPRVFSVSMSLIDRRTGVPVTKTGLQTLSVTLTLPEGLRDSNLRILTVDRNGQLENVEYTRNGDSVTIRTNYLSAFAFCNVAETE